MDGREEGRTDGPSHRDAFLTNASKNKAGKTATRRVGAGAMIERSLEHR